LNEYLSRVDTAHLKSQQLISDAFTSIVKTLNFLGFFDESQKLQLTDAKGKQRAYLDVLGDILG